MIGAIIVAVVLVIGLPIGFFITGAVGSAVMGWLLKGDAETTHEGSELIATNR